MVWLAVKTCLTTLWHPSLVFGHQVVATWNLFSKGAIKAYLEEANRPDLIVHSAGKVGGIAANIADPAGFFRQKPCHGDELARGGKGRWG